MVVEWVIYQCVNFCDIILNFFKDHSRKGASQSRDNMIHKRFDIIFNHHYVINAHNYYYTLLFQLLYFYSFKGSKF